MYQKKIINTSDKTSIHSYNNNNNNNTVIKAKKYFGQNFCTNKNLCKEIVEKLDVSSSDVIIEIGAGTGALTKYLASLGCKVYSFEIDLSLKEILANLNLTNVTFIWEDVLKFDKIGNLIINGGPDSLCNKAQTKSYVVCGNLPYYCATAIIKKFIRISPLPKKLVFLVQKEVAERIIAQPNSKDYGYLSAEIQLFANVKLGNTYSPASFKPAPKVYSSVIEIIPLDLSTYEIAIRNTALEILSVTLKNRRKYAISQLIKEYDLMSRFKNFINQNETKLPHNAKLFWEELFTKLNIPLQIRGEAISLEKLLSLAKEIYEF